MKFQLSEIQTAVEATHFRDEVVEKVLHLLNLLNALDAHPFLTGKFALKGGTALNLFLLDVPRLSVDIDLNYIGQVERDEMLSERPKIEQAMQAVFEREGFKVKRMPTEHAGGKWRLSYESVSGRTGNLEVDLNFMFRLPLWDTVRMDSCLPDLFQARSIPLLDPHELAAGKLAALLSRCKARDLFDCDQIFRVMRLDEAKLRIAFVVYGAMNRKDWRRIGLDDISVTTEELVRQLLPVMRNRDVLEGRTPVGYGEQLTQSCRSILTNLLPFTENETEFLNQLLDIGQISADLLTENPVLQERIARQPLLEWKSLNVRQMRGVKGSQDF